MLNRTLRFTSALGTSLLLLAPGISLAEVDTSDWECESCPFEDGYRADVEAGATYVGEDGAIRFGNATGYDDKGGYANVDGQGRYVSDGYRLDWTVEDLGLDSRVFTLEAGRQGSFGVRVGYRDLPYRQFDTTRTVFDPSRSDTLTLPSDWVPAGLTTNMTRLSSTLRRQNIGSDRQIIDIGADWRPATAFRLSWYRRSRQTRRRSSARCSRATAPCALRQPRRSYDARRESCRRDPLRASAASGSRDSAGA